MKATVHRRAFKDRVRHWADTLEVDVVRLAVRPMRNKWASCSTAGHLNFNAELLDLDEDLRDYVIVHELLHFSVPNHGKLWKSLMHAYLGDYQALERRLPVRRARKPNESRGAGAGGSLLDAEGSRSRHARIRIQENGHVK